MTPITTDTIIDFIDFRGNEWTLSARVRELLKINDKAEIQRLLMLLNSVTEARNRAEAQRDAFTDLYRAVSRERDAERDNAILMQWERDKARALNIQLTRDLRAAIDRINEFSPAPQRSGPSKSSEGSDSKPQAPRNAEAGENPFIGRVICARHKLHFAETNGCPWCNHPPQEARN